MRAGRACGPSGSLGAQLRKRGGISFQAVQELERQTEALVNLMRTHPGKVS